MCVESLESDPVNAFLPDVDEDMTTHVYSRLDLYQPSEISSKQKVGEDVKGKYRTAQNYFCKQGSQAKR